MSAPLDPSRVRTPRTVLRPPTIDDLDAVHAIYGDPATWTHLPSGVLDRAATAAMLERMVAGWVDHGLGDWIVEETLTGQVLGISGTHRMAGRPLRNLRYRLAPETWGSGLGTEVGAAALEVAHAVDPQTPITARVLGSNPVSMRVLVKLGLALVAQQPRDDGLVRQVYADREVSPSDLAHLIALG